MRKSTVLVVSIVLFVLAFAILPASAIVSITGLGNNVTDRAITDGIPGQTWNDFTVLDIDPAYTITQNSKLTEWNWYVKDYVTQDPNQQMELELWRPVTGSIQLLDVQPGGDDPTYELIYKQLVTSTGLGYQTAAVTGNVIAQPGDVLGYYVPTGNNPVLALDYQNTAGGDWYWLSSGNVGVGTQHDFNTNNGVRTYSLFVDTTTVPEPSTLPAAIGLLSPAALMFLRRRRA